MSEQDYQRMTDAERVSQWGDQRGVVPARRADTDEFVFVREEEIESVESTDELTWEEFNDEFERRDMEFRYEEEPAEGEGIRYEFAEAESAASDIEPEHPEAGDVLEEGETARSEVTETRTVEKEVVERDVVESEVVGEEIIGEEVTDTELVERELSNCWLEEGGAVLEADVRERKRVTTEVRERDEIESRVVDSEIEETSTVDAETTDRDVESEGELVDEATAEREVAESDIREREQTDVESEVVDAEAQRDEQIERRIIESEVDEHYHVRAPIDQRDLVEDETVNEEVVETELIEDAEMAESEPETTSAVTEVTDEHGRDTESESSDSVVEVTEEEEGKDVLGANGQTVGMVNAVEDSTIYVDPDTGITDRLTTGLGWGSDEEGTTVEAEQIKEIGSNSVRLSPVGEEELEEGRS